MNNNKRSGVHVLSALWNREDISRVKPKLLKGLTKETPLSEYVGMDLGVGDGVVKKFYVEGQLFLVVGTFAGNVVIKEAVREGVEPIPVVLAAYPDILNGWMPTSNWNKDAVALNMTPGEGNIGNRLRRLAEAVECYQLDKMA